MKMPEKHDLLAAILAAKEQGIGATLCLQWRTFAADIIACLQKIAIDATMCAIIAQFIRDLLDFAGLSSIRLYNERVYHYIGTDSIGSVKQRLPLKKPE